MRSFLRRSYQVVAWLAVVAIITQFLLAGLGVFATAQVGGFGPHRLYGATAVLLSILLLIIFSFVARVPWRYAGLAGLLFFQFFLQYVFLQFYWHAGRSVGGISDAAGALKLGAIHAAMARPHSTTLCGDQTDQESRSPDGG